jgi:hypothetical protein
MKRPVATEIFRTRRDLIWVGVAPFCRRGGLRVAPVVGTFAKAAHVRDPPSHAPAWWGSISNIGGGTTKTHLDIAALLISSEDRGSSVPSSAG